MQPQFWLNGVLKCCTNPKSVFSLGADADVPTVAVPCRVASSPLHQLMMISGKKSREIKLSQWEWSQAGSAEKEKRQAAKTVSRAVSERASERVSERVCE